MDIASNQNPNPGILENINSPEDLRKLSIEELSQVADELRQDIINEVSANPGHFAASLGTVELTIALHYVFNTPYDRIVWDVGHQAYGHKILTGRREAFRTNRKFKGIRPFPSPQESPYDTFACGHASNSISAALGMAVAAELKGETDRRIVAVIGDGSMSGGLAYEGLNNLSSTCNDLLVILNDNNMSIDRSVGGMGQYLLNLTTTGNYNKARYWFAKTLSGIGLLSERRRKALTRAGNSLKAILAKQQNVFEGMDIRYFGPVDGHDIPGLIKVLRSIKDYKGPKLLHIHTVKGKGFEPAEKDPTFWHAAGKFDPKTGERLGGDESPKPLRFQDVFGHTILQLARENDRIIGITAAMAQGTGLSILSEAMPERCYDVGIAEGHAVTFAAGLAKEGLQPFCCIYSSFLQRGFDQIIHDVAFQNLPVVFCLDRAGLVGEDGPTHHGQFDMAYLRLIPNLTVSSPMDEHELRRLMYTAQKPGMGPFAIRYPRGRGRLLDWECPLEEVEVGKGRQISQGEKVAILSIGPIGCQAQDAISEVAKEQGLHPAHYDMRFIKPLDTGLLDRIAAGFETIITIEDGCLNSGFGAAVCEYMERNGYGIHVRSLGIPDDFIEHGSVEELYQLCGMDKASLKKEIIKAFQS